MNAASLTSFFCIPTPPVKHDSTSSNEIKKKLDRTCPDTYMCYGMKILLNWQKMREQPHSIQLQEREFKIIASKYRKDLTSARSFFDDCSWLIKRENLTQTTCSRNDLQKILPQYKFSDTVTGLKMKTCISAFLSQTQYDDFIAYSQSFFVNDLYTVYQAFLEKLAVDVQKFFEAVRLIKKVKDLSTREKLPMIELLANKNLCFKFGAKYSSWNPIQPITELINQLKSNGPHLIRGPFGRSYYEEDPQVTSTIIEGKSLHFWKKGSARKNLQWLPNSIVIVGADEKLQHVYYLDTKDDSQKLYVISYENLTNNIQTLTPFLGPSNLEFFSDEKDANQYAFHM